MLQVHRWDVKEKNNLILNTSLLTPFKHAEFGQLSSLYKEMLSIHGTDLLGREADRIQKDLIKDTAGVILLVLETDGAVLLSCYDH